MRACHIGNGSYCDSLLISRATTCIAFALWWPHQLAESAGAQFRRTPKANNYLAGPALGWPMDWDTFILMLWLIWSVTVMAALIAVLFFV